MFVDGFVKVAGAPSSRRKYREMDIKDLDPHKEDEIWTAKIDGAHGMAVMKKGKSPRIYSHRISKRTNNLIEYTDKIPHVNMSSPFDATVRLEVYATHKDANSVSPEVMTSLLNSNVERSLELQKNLKLNTQTALIDVDHFAGKDMRGASGQEKFHVMQQILQKYPQFHAPDTAHTPDQKINLLRNISSGNHPQTKEGIVVLKGMDYIKAKLSKEHDVHIRSIFQEESERAPMAGGFDYSWEANGPIIGKVGTGFDHAMKKDMLEHPEKYVGKVARVRALAVSKNNVLQKPSFQMMHVEKNLE